MLDSVDERTSVITPFTVKSASLGVVITAGGSRALPTWALMVP